MTCVLLRPEDGELVPCGEPAVASLLVPRRSDGSGWPVCARHLEPYALVQATEVLGPPLVGLPRRLGSSQCARIERLTAAGHGAAHIARVVGISAARVTRHLRRLTKRT